MSLHLNNRGAEGLDEHDDPRRSVGCADGLTACPGDTLSCKVSTLAGRYRASLVRAIHGDVNPAGTGFKEERLESAFEGEYAGRRQSYPSGSYVEVADADRLAIESFTLQAWILPTLAGPGAQ